MDGGCKGGGFKGKPCGGIGGWGMDSGMAMGGKGMGKMLYDPLMQVSSVPQCSSERLQGASKGNLVERAAEWLSNCDAEEVQVSSVRHFGSERLQGAPTGNFVERAAEWLSNYDAEDGTSPSKLQNKLELNQPYPHHGGFGSDQMTWASEPVKAMTSLLPTEDLPGSLRALSVGSDPPLDLGAQVDQAGIDQAGHLPSLGSALHKVGSCKPCLFMHTTSGCPNGAFCDFCHLIHRKEKARPCKGKRDRCKKLLQRMQHEEGIETACSSWLGK